MPCDPIWLELGIIARQGREGIVKAVLAFADKLAHAGLHNRIDRHKTWALKGGIDIFIDDCRLSNWDRVVNQTLPLIGGDETLSSAGNSVAIQRSSGVGSPRMSFPKAHRSKIHSINPC